MSDTHNHYGGGVSLGSIVAGVLSWMKWHSIGYAIIHAILGWVYVSYYALKYGF